MIKQFVNYAFLIFNLGLIFMFFNNLERSFKIPETLHRPNFFHGQLYNDIHNY